MAYNKKTTDTTTVEHVTHHSGHDEAHFREKHLMLDPLPRGQMNEMVMEAMHHTTWKFWVVWGLLAAVVAYGLFYSWGVMILEGLGVAGVNRPSYWGIFLVNTVFWIGISHAGTFISAILRVFKAEFRRPFTRAAELMTTFGLVQAGFSVFMHMGRVAGLLVVPDPQPASDLAQSPLAAIMGSCRDHYLLAGFDHVPLSAIDP
jgi:hypothetical protein